MDRTLANFIRALRNAEVRISTAETLDAFNTVELVGYQDRALLKRSLSLVLPKTADEKETFDNCFDQFFSFTDVHGAQSPAANDDAGKGDGEPGDAAGEGDGGGGGGEPRGAGSRAAGGGRKSRQPPGADAEEEEDLGQGEMTEAQSALGRMLMTDAKVDLSLAVAAAGEAVGVREIEVFTQKGLYTRKIMEEMGLADLNREISDLREAPAVPARRLGQELRRRRD